MEIIFRFGSDKRKFKEIEKLRDEIKILKIENQELRKNNDNLENKNVDLEQTLEFKNLVEEVIDNVNAEKNTRKNVK